MGLDTTHNCWSGPYSMFMRWRQELHRYIGDGTKTLEEAWAAGDYADQSVPINVLMNHSDCDGEIAADRCGPLADALEALLVRMPESGMYDGARPATERFIKGLRVASAAGEAVEFH